MSCFPHDLARDVTFKIAIDEFFVGVGGVTL